MNAPTIPQPFRERYSSLCENAEAFFASLQTPLPRSCRVNTLKTTAERVLNRFRGYGIPVRQAPWYSDALITDDVALGDTIEHFLGAIYIQDLASMLPPLVVRDLLASAEHVLDACAAPGSKTTQLAALMNNRGTVVANDVDHQRIKALKFNVEKTGAVNVVITNYDLHRFPDVKFDLIFLDAPCSSEGTVRKDPGVFRWWAPRHIYSTAGRQKRMIVKAFDMLVDGGVLVYSTCTFAPEENEAVVHSLLQQRDAVVEPVELDQFCFAPAITSWRGEEFDPRVKNSVRVFPHENDTGGFFLARIRK